MTETAFVLILMFASWDDCIAFAAARPGTTEQAEYLCEQVEHERKSLAPEKSIRPRARGE